MTKKYVDDNGGGGGNPFDQDLNTTDTCNFAGYQLDGVDVEVVRGTAGQNILVGLNAGSIGSGSVNYAIGDDALAGITTQTGNIAIGQSSQTSSTATDNVSVGHSIGYDFFLVLHLEQITLLWELVVVGE